MKSIAQLVESIAQFVPISRVGRRPYLFVCTRRPKEFAGAHQPPTTKKKKFFVDLGATCRAICIANAKQIRSSPKISLQFFGAFAACRMSWCVPNHHISSMIAWKALSERAKRHIGKFHTFFSWRVSSQTNPKFSFWRIRLFSFFFRCLQNVSSSKTKEVPNFLSRPGAPRPGQKVGTFFKKVSPWTIVW